jgi:predicted DNA-binding transcriptional regulator AlpA
MFSNVKGPMAKQANETAPIPVALQHFDELPDSANVRLPVVAGLEGVSDPTVWRWSGNGKLPRPNKHGGVATWNVGELRRARAARTADMGKRTASATAAAAAKRATAPTTV